MLSAPEFSIYMNDLFDVEINGRMQMYADDIVIMIASPNNTDLIQKMQSDVMKINSWLQKNKLRVHINTKKTYYIIF